MARTLEPNTVLNEFLARTQASFDRYTALYATVPYTKKTLDLRKGLASDVVFRLGSDWETFQHEWFLAAISKRPAKFRKNVTTELDSLTQRSNLKHMLEVLWPGCTELPDRLSRDQIALLADPEGYNVSFKDNEVWLRKAKLDLDDTYSAKIEGVVSTPEDACVLDLLRSLRNAIAHGSTGSLSRLNECARPRATGKKTGVTGSANDFLARSGGTRIRHVPTYLHGWQPALGSRRAPRLLGRVEEIAEKLRV